MSCLWVTLTLLLWQIQPPSPCPAVTPMFPPIWSCDPVWTLTHLLPFNMQTSHFHSPDSLLCLLCTLMSYPSDPSPFLWPSAFWILILSLTHLDNFASFCIHTFLYLSSTVFVFELCFWILFCPYWAIACSFGSIRTSQCGCLKWADQSWLRIGFCYSQQREWTRRQHRELQFSGEFPV